MRFRSSLSCVVAAGGLAACALVSGSKPLVVGVSDLEQQRLSGPTKVIARDAGVMSSIYVLVTVDPSGRVTDAKLSGNNQKLDPNPGIAAVRSWRFKPQQFDGRPITAVGTVHVDYEPPEQRTSASVPFPQGDLADSEITLERSACFGSCPDYAVRIRGDGAVRFSTREDVFSGSAAEVHRAYQGHSVVLPGVHEAHVDPNRVRALLDRFRAAGFFGLKASYRASITDASTQALTVRIGRTSKTVEDYVGKAVGMPAIVSDLEDAVDSVAGSNRWVKGNAETIPLLQARGMDFRSTQAAELALAASLKPDFDPKTGDLNGLLIGMIERGLPLDMAAPWETRWKSPDLGSIPLLQAADAGNETLFSALAGRGYLKRTVPADLTKVFAAGLGCSPRIARAIVQGGANSHPPGSDESALLALRGIAPVCDKRGKERLLLMAQTLIALGAPLEGHDGLGWTPLMGCNSPGLAKMLIAAGAKVNGRAKDGETPLLTTDDDRVALILLRAGADPRAKDDDGSVRQQALKRHMPATLAWLDSNRVP